MPRIVNGIEDMRKVGARHRRKATHGQFLACVLLLASLQIGAFNHLHFDATTGQAQDAHCVVCDTADGLAGTARTSGDDAFFAHAPIIPQGEAPVLASQALPFRQRAPPQDQ